MKRIKLILLLLIGFLLSASAQDPEQWFPGLTKLDTALFRLNTALPSNPESGFFLNVNGYAMWYDGIQWDTLQSGGGVGGGVTDHGLLTGLADDDHTQYYNTSRINSWFLTKSHSGLLDVGTNTHTQIDVHIASTTNPHSVDEDDILPTQTGNNGKALVTNGTSSYWTILPSGVTDHGLLNGLGDDDHTIYHTDSRANVWFATQNLSNLANKSHTSLTDIGSNTHTQIDGHISSYINPHSVTSSQVLPSQVGNNGKALVTDGASVSWQTVSGGTSDHGALTGLGDDDHTQYHNDARASTWLTTENLANLGTKSHTSLTDIGTNTHTQIDGHISNTSNPHSVDFLGLSDSPSAYTGQSGKSVVVNLAENGVEFSSTPGSSTLISVTDCDYNDTTYITVGDTTDLGFRFRYEAKRNMTTLLSQAGDINMVYDSIAKSVSFSSTFVGANLGLSLRADINNADVRLMVIVNSTNTNNLTFNLHSSNYTDIDTIITNSPNKAISYTTCPDNDTTYIVIGALADVSFHIDYVAERNIIPARKQKGTIDVLYDDVAGTIEAYNDYIGTDIGFNIEADISGSNLRLMIIVDNSTTNNLLFDHRILSKFYE